MTGATARWSSRRGTVPYRAKIMASMTLDFPAPVGPVRANRSAPAKSTTSVPEGREALDLQPHRPHGGSRFAELVEQLGEQRQRARSSSTPCSARYSANSSSGERPSRGGPRRRPGGLDRARPTTWTASGRQLAHLVGQAGPGGLVDHDPQPGRRRCRRPAPARSAQRCPAASAAGGPRRAAPAHRGAAGPGRPRRPATALRSPPRRSRAAAATRSSGSGRRPGTAGGGAGGRGRRSARRGEGGGGTP